MKNLSLIVCFLFSVNSFSQANILNATTPSEIGIQNFDQKQSDNDSFLEFDYIDEQGWPHYKCLKQIPNLKAGEQSILMKDAIVNYFLKSKYIQ